MSVAIPIVLLLALLMLGVPVAFSLLISGMAGIWMNTGMSALIGFTQTVPYRTTATYALITIPMFILMAQLITRGGLASNIFDSLKIWSGRAPGGVAVATVFASAGLGAVCGSSAASAATMGSIATPELKRLGYPPSFSVGSVAVAGTLAVMIPPSTGLILYAILSNTSVGGMLIAGIIPGILTALAYAVLVMSWALPRIRRGELPRGRSYSIRQKLRGSMGTWPFGVLIALVLGGIYSGAVSAIEASAIGAVGAFILMVIMRKLSWRDAREAVRETAYTTTMIFAILIGATVFGYFLSVTRVPERLLGTLTGAGLSRWAILFLILGFVFILGFFMDQIAILSLSIPVVFPIIQSLEFNPIWFGILFTALAEVGLVTPPMGLNVFVTCAASGDRIETGFAGVWRFVLVQLGMLAIFIAFPALTTVLVPSRFT